VTVSGDVVPRRDTEQQLFVVVLSNAVHIAAGTGRLITCPFIPGDIPADAMSMVVTVSRPTGVVLPELVQWLPTSALDEPIGNIGPTALRNCCSMVSALVS
jgi:mRNA-degrading endonuclease toxin of MazEF toxin-antitoxin module